MAKSKKKVANKPAKKSAAPKKKPVAKKVVKQALKKAKPAPKKQAKPVAKKAKAVVKHVSKPVHKATAKASKKKVVKAVIVKKPAKAEAKPLIKPTAKITPQVRGKEVVKPIVRKSIQPAKKKELELRTRYSDDELAEFKVLIQDKLEAAKKELKYLQDQINRKDDNGTDDTENKFASSDDGSSSMEREYLNQMAARQIMYLDHLDKALVRIQNKTYGICRVTGKLIEKERLKSVPHATLSMEAKLMQSH